MTNDEVIEVFKGIIAWSKLNEYPYVSKQEIEAYEKAINILTGGCEGCKYNDGSSEFKAVCYHCSRTHTDNYTSMEVKDEQ